MNSNDLIFFTLIVCMTAIGLIGLIILGKILLKAAPKPKIVYLLTYPLGSVLQADGTTIPTSEIATRILKSLREGKDIACSAVGRKEYRLTAMDYETGETISERYLDP